MEHANNAAHESDPTGDPTGDSTGYSSGDSTGDAGPRAPEARRGLRKWYLGSLVALSFLAIAMVQAATSGDSAVIIVAFELLAVCFAAIYMLGLPWASGGVFVVARSREAVVRCAAVLVAMLAITVPMIIIGGVGVTGLWIYIGVAAAVMLPARWAIGVAGVLAAAMLVATAVATRSVGWGDLPWELALTLVALTGWMLGFGRNIRTTHELRRTRDELARAAVAAERARIGRDLHDILGHSLTAIAVKAGLTRRLLGRDEAAATAEVADIERLARDALTDVRATAAGYRDVSLAGELAVARAVLQAAGIHADLPTAVDDVDPAGRELFGYVVREAVTNVVRHSGATSCTIELRRHSVTVTDDGAGRTGAGPTGAGPPGFGVTGAGLAGLADRVHAAGGSFRAGRSPHGGFRVVATVGVTVPPGAASGDPAPAPRADPSPAPRADPAPPASVATGGNRS